MQAIVRKTGIFSVLSLVLALAIVGCSSDNPTNSNVEHIDAVALSGGTGGDFGNDGYTNKEDYPFKFYGTVGRVDVDRRTVMFEGKDLVAIINDNADFGFGSTQGTVSNLNFKSLVSGQEIVVYGKLVEDNLAFIDLVELTRGSVNTGAIEVVPGRTSEGSLNSGGLGSSGNDREDFGFKFYGEISRIDADRRTLIFEGKDLVAVIAETADIFSFTGTAQEKVEFKALNVGQNIIIYGTLIQDELVDVQIIDIKRNSLNMTAEYDSAPRRDDQ